MSIVNQEVAVIDETLWDAWLVRHKRREERNARVATRFAVGALVLGIIGTTIFVLVG